VACQTLQTPITSARGASFSTTAILVFLHPHPAAPEQNAFRFQAKALLESLLARQQDLSASAYHPVPWQTARVLQGPNHLPCRARKTCRSRNIAICGNFAFRNLANGVPDDVEHDALLRLVPSQGVSQTVLQ